MYTMSSGLVGRDLRFQIPDVSPATDVGETSGICNLRHDQPVRKTLYTLPIKTDNGELKHYFLLKTQDFSTPLIISLTNLHFS